MRKEEGGYEFTSESVTEGHPDKMCDQIADAILDELLAKDPNTRAAVEVTASNDFLHIFGEVTTSAKVDYEKVAREVIDSIGYANSDLPGGEDYKVVVSLNKQSPDIASGVNRNGIMAGDQGMMFGYACDETEDLMPLSAVLAHKLCKRLAEVRKFGVIPYLKPDGKAQVTLAYDRDNKPLFVKTIIISTQHQNGIEQEMIQEDLIQHVIHKTIPDGLLNDETQILINPSGRFVLGGPTADSGLTGRKIIVDTYGSKGRHGGGAFSGKDSTKVDRSGAYIARYIAKNIVGSGLAKECEVQISYAIGKKDPVSFKVDTFGTGVLQDHELAMIVMKVVDHSPQEIIELFGLQRPIFRQFAAYGHFGRPRMMLGGEELDTPWEKVELTDVFEDEIEIEMRRFR
jgi:S-adenosylmethionine synthetase